MVLGSIHNDDCGGAKKGACQKEELLLSLKFGTKNGGCIVLVLEKRKKMGMVFIRVY